MKHKYLSMIKYGVLLSVIVMFASCGMQSSPYYQISGYKTDIGDQPSISYYDAALEKAKKMVLVEEYVNISKDYIEAKKHKDKKKINKLSEQAMGLGSYKDDVFPSLTAEEKQNYELLQKQVNNQLDAPY